MSDPLAQWLGETAQAKTREHVTVLAGQWDRLGPRFRRLMPNVEVQKPDLFWHLGILELVEDRSERCSTCDPSRWDPDSEDKRKWSCPSPLLPVVVRTGERPAPEANVGRLRVSWVPCEVYRGWAKAREKRQTGGGRRAKTYGRFEGR